MRFISVILSIILGFYLLGIIGRLWLRYWIAKKQREFEKNGTMGGFSFKQYRWPGGGDRQERPSPKEGEIRVDKPGQTQKKVSGKVGDYVDYEEIK